MTHTVASLTAACIEDGDCLIWQGSKTTEGAPRIKADDDSRRSVRARRRMFELHGGQTTKRQPNVIATCWHPLCIAPEHLAAVSRKEQMLRAAAAGRLRVPSRDAAQRRIKRADPSAKLTMAKAREIRSRYFAGATLVSLAAEFDVHVSLIHRVVHNKAWAEGAANSSVFSMVVGAL